VADVLQGLFFPEKSMTCNLTDWYCPHIVLNLGGRAGAERAGFC